MFSIFPMWFWLIWVHFGFVIRLKVMSVEVHDVRLWFHQPIHIAILWTRHPHNFTCFNGYSKRDKMIWNWNFKVVRLRLLFHINWFFKPCFFFYVLKRYKQDLRYATPTNSCTSVNHDMLSENTKKLVHVIATTRTENLIKFQSNSDIFDVNMTLV